MQSAFLPQRRTTDNIIIAQEVIDHLSKLRSKKSYFILKLDMEKDFDRVEWSFIKVALKFFNFPQRFIDIIMAYLSSSQLSVLINGQPSPFFQPSRGIRQGDPLSPYIFIICMEYLSLLIFEAVRKKSWCPLYLSRNGPHISHLLFADDVLLIARTDSSSIFAMKKILAFFSNISNQKISLSKSRIYFSPNTTVDSKNYLTTAFNIPITSN